VVREAINLFSFNVTGPATSPDKIRDRINLLQTLFRDLSARELELLARYYLDGEDVRSVAEALGMTEAEVEALNRKVSRPARAKPYRLAAAAGE
jgi:DNA-directed RNA polymerase specialized sigma subunit